MRRFILFALAAPLVLSAGCDNGSNPHGDVICEANSRECYGNSVFICSADGTAFLAPEDCTANQFCRDGSCFDALCTGEEVVCDDDFGYKVCLPDGSGFGDVLPCGNGMYCRNGACLEQVCEPDQPGCVGNARGVCASDGSAWQDLTACEADQFCSAGVCETQLCLPNAWECEDGSVRHQCLPDGSGYGNPVACATGEYCQAGSCVAQVCEPESTECDGNAVKTCDAQGSAWGLPVDCGVDEICASGACLPGVCDPGTTVCGGDSVLTCRQDGNGYDAPVPCEADEFCQDGGCLTQVCTPQARQCDGDGEVIICNAQGSAWSAPDPCDANQYCNEGYCYTQECSPNLPVCEDVHNYKVCNEDGSGYGAPVACAQDNVCLAGVCIPQVCEPLTASCQGNSVVVCNQNGTGYSTPVPCDADHYCQDGACQGQLCSPGERQCQGNSVIVCDAQGAAWSDPTPCGQDLFCRDGSCLDQLCTPNEQACADDFGYHICTTDGSGWGDTYPCAQNEYCLSGACNPQVCTPDATECLGQTTYRQCLANGSGWGADQTCSGNFRCHEGECLDPSDVPNPAIEIAFVRPQPAEIREMTQGEALSVLVNAVMQGGTISSVDLIIDDVVYATDPSLPYEFAYVVPVDALTGATFAMVARAHGDDGTFNDAAPCYVFVRNDPPEARFTATVSGDRQVTVDASNSTDRETTLGALEVRWDFENDGSFGSWTTDKVATFTYADYGLHTIAMEVRDEVLQVAGTTHQVDFSDISYVSGVIDEDVTWYGTVIVTGDVSVEAGATLTVSAGTEVLFVYQDTLPADGVGDYSLDITDGSLIVEGTVDEPVLFSVYGDEERHPGAWGRILLNNDDSQIEHAIIEYGDECLDIHDGSDLTSVEVRNCASYGVRLTGASNNVMTDLSIHDCDADGLVIQSSSSAWSFDGLDLFNNGQAGAHLTGSVSGSIDNCDVHHNGQDGFRIESSTPAIADCDIHENGRTGLYYSGTQGGSLTHSQVRINDAEGIRIQNTNSSPVIQWNNVYSNSVVGGTRIESYNPSAVLSVTTSAWNGYTTSGVWTPPNGGEITRMRITYTESDSSSNYMSGGIRQGTNVLWSTSTARTNYWVDLGSQAPTSAHVYVLDNNWGGQKHIEANQAVVALSGQAGVEMSVDVLNTKVDARFNYWGVFPNALGAVSMSAPSAVDMQGFVGVMFDASWDRGPYIGGLIDADLNLSGDIYVTGDITVQPGVTLTLAAGTRMLFVKHDQDGNGAGDFSIGVDGALQAIGSGAQPIVFDGLGSPAPADAFEYVRLSGNGSTLDYVTMANGLNDLAVDSCDASMDHLDLSLAHNVCLVFTNPTGASLSNSQVTDCGSDGVWVIGGTVSLAYVQSTQNGGHGLLVSGDSADVTLTDSTLRYNGGDGARVQGPAIVDFSYDHFGDNLNGLTLLGNVAGSVTYSNLSFNDRQGFLIHQQGSATPSAAINYNNIFSNAVTESFEVAQTDTSAILHVSTTAWNGYTTSANWTAPDDGNILWTQITYTESDSSSNYMSGGVRQGTSVLWSTSTNKNNFWVDLTNQAPQSMHVYVLDNNWGGSKVITASQTLYGAMYANPIAMTAYATSSASIDAQFNWWSGSMNPASQISQVPSGLVDYTGFTGTAYTVGPR